ncbi:MAG TPA: hypothetical protein VN408_06535, partial [Actinoplanes sp.]|nr:hypothetical protein [Actinoplanes sp.]
MGEGSAFELEVLQETDGGSYLATGGDFQGCHDLLSGQRDLDARQPGVPGLVGCLPGVCLALCLTFGFANRVPLVVGGVFPGLGGVLDPAF